MRSVFTKMGLKSCIIYTIAMCICASASQAHFPTLHSPNKEMLYRLDVPFVLNCSVSGHDRIEIKYSWLKNGKPLVMTNDMVLRGGNLHIVEPTDADEGIYTCLAESSYGVASTSAISVRKAYIKVKSKVIQQHRPLEGAPFKLECRKPDAYPEAKVYWLYQQNIDPTISNTILDKRITQAPDGTLYFSNVTRDDTNDNFKFVCLASSPAVDEAVVLAEHRILDVKESQGDDYSQLVPQYLSHEVVAKAGEMAQLFCIYGGTPLAHPDWFFEGVDVNGKPRDRVTRYNRSAGKRLLIRKTLRSDQGTYSCKADNGVGTPQMHSMKLTVISAPVFTTEEHLPILSSAQGTDVVIPCRASGVSSPIITWTHNAKPLKKTDRVFYNRIGTEETDVVGNLVIRKLTRSDVGYYGCEAVNEHGSLYAETLLVVT